MASGTITKNTKPTEWVNQGGSTLHGYQVSGNTVTLSLGGAVTITDGYLSDFYLPQNLRPSRNIYFVAKEGGSFTTSKLCEVVTDGRVMVFNSTGVNYLYGSCSFIVD